MDSEIELQHALDKYLKDVCPYVTDHLTNTSSRFIKYIKEYTTGYHADIAKCTENALYLNDKNNHQILNVITQNDIPFTSVCIHHLLPFYGVIHIKYEPNNYILGLSKFSRVCQILSNRLNIQEQFGDDIVKHLVSILQPKFLEVTIEAYHCCMSCRGIKTNAKTVTTHSYSL